MSPNRILLTAAACLLALRPFASAAGPGAAAHSTRVGAGKSSVAAVTLPVLSLKKPKLSPALPSGLGTQWLMPTIGLNRPMPSKSLEPVMEAPASIAPSLEFAVPIQVAETPDSAAGVLNSLERGVGTLQDKNNDAGLEIRRIYENGAMAAGEPGLPMPQLSGPSEYSNKRPHSELRRYDSSAANETPTGPPEHRPRTQTGKKRGSLWGFGAITRKFKKKVFSESSVSEALDARDMELTNELLTSARRIHGLISVEDEEKAERLALSIYSGRYAEARDALEEVALSSVMMENLPAFMSQVALLRDRLPMADLAVSGTIRRAVDEVLSTAAADPFQIQKRMTRLLSGLTSTGIPKPLSRRQVELAKKASWMARAAGEARKGPATGPLQKLQDCWVRSVYDLPIPAMDSLRAAMTYERFLGRVKKMFPDKDFSKEGLGFQEYPKLLRLMGLQTKQKLVTGPQLEALLKTHGAVIAGMAWFDKDVSAKEDSEALGHWMAHATIIKGVEGPEEDRQFQVWDSLKEHETRYTMEELGLLQIIVFTVEPWDIDSAETLKNWLAEDSDRTGLSPPPP